MKRWPIIRHIRWVYLSYRVHQWARACGRMGLGLGVPHDSDLRHLQAIWDGRA